MLATSANLRELAALDVEDATATSSADAVSSKPAPGIPQAALEQRRLTPGTRSWLGHGVGLEAEARAGLPWVGVLTGSISRDELSRVGAAAVYDDVAALRAELLASPVGALLTRA